MDVRSPGVLSRAFYQVWHCKPSEYHKEKRYYELFPRILCPLEIGDEYMDTRRHVDISELYDLFRERSECFFICCNIKNLTEINELSRKARDQAILETLNQMYGVSGIFAMRCKPIFQTDRSEQEAP